MFDNVLLQSLLYMCYNQVGLMRISNDSLSKMSDCKYFFQLVK